MTIQRSFFNWQTADPDSIAHASCSPNLLMLEVASRAKWHTDSIGCFGRRPVRGGKLPSSHSYGAAIDIRYPSMSRAQVVDEMIPWLVAWSSEMQIDAIHDYRGSRIWRAGRTEEVGDACTKWWKAQRQDGYGMGREWANWLHIETTHGGWSDGSDFGSRGIG